MLNLELRMNTIDKISRTSTHIGRATSLLFGCAALLFWGMYYPHHLHYQEQYQLFLFTPEYWSDKLAHPGGIAEYLAEFLTQFYYYAWAGAAILASCLVILQRQMGWLARKRDARLILYPLSFLPSICLWVFLCDENAMLAFVVSLLITVYAVMIYQRISRYMPGRLLYAFLIMPLLYWIVGGVYLIFVLWVGMDEGIGKADRAGRALPTPAKILLCAGSILLGLLYPLLAQISTQYPLLSLLTGIDYYRFPMLVPASMILTMIMTIATPQIMALLTSSVKRPVVWLTVEMVLIILGGGYWVYKASDLKKEESMKYDYLARTKRWDLIIKAAEKKEPDSPFAVTCLNLALAKTGQLGDRMFHFYQNGTEGLIPEFQKDFTSPLPTSEIFYHLGMINSSQRYMFEAMESIPNYRKSTRAYQRLAETNLINGQYAVSAKYLRALQHTLFYKDWATETLTYLGDDTRIEKHPEWGWLRKARYTEDFLFSNAEMDMMLGLLLQHNPRNRLAFEYLTAYVLLRKDLEGFLKYYPLGKDLGYDHIPLSYQEALIFVWTQQHSNFQGLPWSISRNVQERVTEFAGIYTKQQNSEPLLRPKYEKTFWYYLLFRK